MRGVNHRGAAGRREPPLSAWEKWESLKGKCPRTDKSAEQQGPSCVRLQPDVEQLQTGPHFLCPNSQNTLSRRPQHTHPPCGVSQADCGGNETPYHQTSPSSPHPDENPLHAASAARCVANLRNTASIFPPPETQSIIALRVLSVLLLLFSIAERFSIQAICGRARRKAQRSHPPDDNH